jgi:hypothetical protein
VRVVTPPKQKRGKHEIKRRKVAVLQGDQSEQATPAATMNTKAAHFLHVQKARVSCGCTRRAMIWTTGGLPARPCQSVATFPLLFAPLRFCLALTWRATISCLDPASARYLQEDPDTCATTTNDFVEENLSARCVVCHSWRPDVGDGGKV